MANPTSDGATPGRSEEAGTDIHDRIAAQAKKLAAAARFGIRDSEDFPEVKALLMAAKAAITEGVQASFQFEGRTYWLSTRLAAELYVYASQAEARPLVSGMDLSTELHGHRPAH